MSESRPRLLEVHGQIGVQARQPTHHVGHPGGGDGRPEAHPQARLLAIELFDSGPPGGIGRCKHGVEMRRHGTAERGELGEVTLPIEQGTAQLLLQLLDCAGQCRLRYVAFRRGPGEVGRAAKREEIADLMEFHRAASYASGPEISRNAARISAGSARSVKSTVTKRHRTVPA